MMEGMRVLKVFNFGDTEAENCYVTISPQSVKLVASYDDQKQGRPVKRLSVMFNEGDNVDLYVSEMDAMTIEQVVGGYGYEMV